MNQTFPTPEVFDDRDAFCCYAARHMLTVSSALGKVVIGDSDGAPLSCVQAPRLSRRLHDKIMYEIECDEEDSGYDAPAYYMPTIHIYQGGPQDGVEIPCTCPIAGEHSFGDAIYTPSELSNAPPRTQVQTFLRMKD